MEDATESYYRDDRIDVYASDIYHDGRTNRWKIDLKECAKDDSASPDAGSSWCKIADDDKLSESDSNLFELPAPCNTQDIFLNSDDEDQGKCIIEEEEDEEGEKLDFNET